MAIVMGNRSMKRIKKWETDPCKLDLWQWENFRSMGKAWIFSKQGWNNWDMKLELYLQRTQGDLSMKSKT